MGFNSGFKGLIPQSIPLQAQRTFADVTGWKDARRRICVFLQSGQQRWQY